MTTEEMLDYFKLLYDVNGSYAVAGFTDDEIYNFINKAQESVVTEFCVSGELDRVRELFSNNEYALTLSSAYGTSCYITEAIDSEYLYYITSRTQLTRTTYPTISSAEWIENIKIPMWQIRNFENNSTNKTMFYNPRIVDIKQLMDIKQVSTVTLSGTSGTCTITTAGVSAKTVTFASSLPVSAANFVSANYATYLSAGVIVSCNGNDIVFTATTVGVPFAIPVIATGAGNLDGDVVETISIITNVISNVFMVFVDSFTTPTTFYIHYVRKPINIDDTTDCELREELHRAIVEKAVQLAEITIADPRVMASIKNQNNDSK